MFIIKNSETCGGKMRYEVLTDTFCDGWVNTWSADDQPHIFNSLAEAQAELDNFLLDSEADGLDYSRDQYKIVEVSR